MRFRYIFMVIGCLLAFASTYYQISDDASGVMALVNGDWAIMALRFFLGVAAMFYGFRAVSDYDDADGESLHAIAKQSPAGAGLALVYRGLTFIAMALLVFAFSGGAARADDRIPQAAYQHLSTLSGLMKAKFPQYPRPEVMAGLIDHESGCPGIKRMCWNASAKLVSAREVGVGMGQTTIAYYVVNGKRTRLRFDALAELKALHPEDLAEVTWWNLPTRPDYQLMTVVLKNRDNWARFRKLAADNDSQVRFAIKSYNRGVGGVLAEIRTCAKTPGCDSRRFVGNAGEICTASRKPIYGKRSACDISLHYTPDIVDKRSPKYRGLV